MYEVEADCYGIHNNECVFKKFRLENCKSLEREIFHSSKREFARDIVSRVLHEISKEHDAIIKGISSSSTLYLPDYGCPADVALGWKSMPLPMPLYRAASRMVLKCRVYTSLGRFHLIFLCLRFDFYCYRRCTKNPENRLPKDPRCCADAGSTRFDLCKRVDGQINHYEMKLSAIIEIIITFILITSKTILNQTKRRRKKNIYTWFSKGKLSLRIYVYLKTGETRFKKIGTRCFSSGTIFSYKYSSFRDMRRRR